MRPIWTALVVLFLLAAPAMALPGFAFDSVSVSEQAGKQTRVQTLAQAQPQKPSQYQPQQQSQQETLTVNQIDGRGWPTVTLNIILTGPDGRAVPGTDVKQFEVREEGQPQAIAGLTLGPAKSIPLAIVLAIDISGSMQGDKLAQAKAAAISFLASLRPEDSATVLSFNSEVRVVVPFTSDKAALNLGINALQAGGNTAAYDALYRSAQLVNSAKPGMRRAIVLLTDGADTSSRYSAGVAADVAKQTSALAYTIGLGPDANDAVLKSLSEPSGGKYYKAPGPADLQGIYTAISVELSSQMLLNYRSVTMIDRPYKLVSVELKYTSKSGQVIVKALRYRPPLAALIPSTPEVSSVATPFPRPVIPPPIGIVQVPGGDAPANTSGPLAVPNRFNMLSMLGSLLVALSVGFLGLALAARFAPSLAGQRLARYTGQLPTVEAAEQQSPTGFGPRVLGPLLQGFARRLARLTPAGYRDHIQQLLLLSGPPYRPQMGEFLVIQVGLSLAFAVPLVWWAVSFYPGLPAQWVLVGALAVTIGIYFPYSWLTRRVRARQRAILHALPGALDFLAINVEAGSGFDAAMTEVVRRWHNPLTDEFALLLIDFQIGKPRRDAWRDLIQRTQVQDLTAFVTAMLQNEQVGSSIGALLRTQAEQARIRRRQRAETAARLAPVKMLLPLVFFIFPGILVVLLGPAIPQFLDAFTTLGH